MPLPWKLPATNKVILRAKGLQKEEGGLSVSYSPLLSSSASEEAQNKTGPPGDSTNQTTVRTGVTGKS